MMTRLTARRLLLALLLLLTACLDATGGLPTPTVQPALRPTLVGIDLNPGAQPTTGAAATATAPSLPDGDLATVTNIIDGDTIDVTLGGRSYRVRYIGIDTPERDEPYYAEASAANRALVAGQRVILVRDVSETDPNGRLLRYIYLQDGTFVNARLIADGYARMVTFPPDTAQSAYFQELQRSARDAGRGLWGLNELAGAPAGCNICDRNAYNCGDFSTQGAAQACYDFCRVQSGLDIHKLDGGGDGVVCEALP